MKNNTLELSTENFFKNKEIGELFNNKISYFPLSKEGDFSFEVVELQEQLSEKGISFINLSDTLNYSNSKLKEYQEYFYPEWNENQLSSLISLFPFNQTNNFSSKIIKDSIYKNLSDDIHGIITYTYCSSLYILPVFTKEDLRFENINNWFNDIFIKNSKNDFSDSISFQPCIEEPFEDLDDEGKFQRMLDNVEKEFEKTMYFKRMAFTVNLPTIKNTINNNELSLSVGGVRAYNQENLYSKKTMEKFKVFIGFQNSVCTNLCINTDGFKGELRASNPQQLKEEILMLFQAYNAEQHLKEMHSFGDYELPEKQFAQFIGRARLYHYLPKQLRQHIPILELNDGQISGVAKAYYEDENFSSFGNNSITLWNLYNLFTGATKSSYIDTFLERTVNAHQIAKGFRNALEGDTTYQWFLG